MLGLSLAAVSVACGYLTLWVFRHTADLNRLRSTIKRIQAHFFEFRLFYDEPRLVWQAQGAILRENVRLLASIALPVIILTLPMALLLIQLEAVYTYAPLRVGAPYVITAQVSGQLTADDSASLTAPPEIAVETPAVRSMADRQISWRIRPLRPVIGHLTLRFRGAAIEKSIDAAARRIFIERKREARLAAGEIAWVEINYPKTDVNIAGISLPWIAWFVLLSTISALVCSRWL